jgi:hypothetical protein
MPGFIFALYKFKFRSESWYAGAVHFLTWVGTRSKFIHVEVIPVLRDEPDSMLVAAESYTIFMGHSFRRSLSQGCLNGDFSLMYLETDSTKAGVEFLESLIDTPYFSLWRMVWVCLPYCVKRLCTCSVPRDSVFCSMAGLMLLQRLGYRAPIPPSLCSPGDLHYILSGIAVPLELDPSPV